MFLIAMGGMIAQSEFSWALCFRKKLCSCADDRIYASAMALMLDVLKRIPPVWWHSLLAVLAVTYPSKIIAIQHPLKDWGAQICVLAVKAQGKPSSSDCRARHHTTIPSTGK